MSSRDPGSPCRAPRLAEVGRNHWSCQKRENWDRSYLLKVTELGWRSLNPPWASWKHLPPGKGLTPRFRGSHAREMWRTLGWGFYLELVCT